MNNRLPVNIENLDLPEDQFKEKDNNQNISTGFVSIMSLISLIITMASILTVLVLGNR